jgi:hypothetical protein
MKSELVEYKSDTEIIDWIERKNSVKGKFCGVVDFSILAPEQFNTLRAAASYAMRVEEGEIEEELGVE